MNIFRRLKGFASEQKGVTLVELLIVISILGILSAIVVANVTGGTAKGRDKAYAADVDGVQTSVDSYYSMNNQYPTALGLGYATVTTNAYIDFYYLVKGQQIRRPPLSAGPLNYTSSLTPATTAGTGSYDWWVDNTGRMHSQNSDGVKDTFNGTYP